MRAEVYDESILALDVQNTAQPVLVAADEIASRVRLGREPAVDEPGLRGIWA